MNIKSLVSNFVPAESLGRTTEKKEVKSENSHEDRDADGKRQQDEGPFKDSLTEEEILEVLAAMREFSGIKENNLTVAVERVDHRVFFKLIDPKGKVIRRMDSNEGWSFVKNKSKESTGQLLDRAM